MTADINSRERDMVRGVVREIRDRKTALEPLHCGIGSLGVPGERCASLAGYVVGPGTGAGHPLLDGARVGFAGLPGRHPYIVDPF